MAGLRKFRAVYEGRIRTLGTLGVNISESGCMFAELILDKCHLNDRDKFERLYLGTDESWTPSELGQAISNRFTYSRAKHQFDIIRYLGSMSQPGLLKVFVV